jgi:hypothetical protein
MAFYNAYASGSKSPHARVLASLLIVSGAEFYAGEELSRERNRARLNTSDHFVDMNPDSDVSPSQALPIAFISDSLSRSDAPTPQWTTATVEKEELKDVTKRAKTKRKWHSVWLCVVAAPLLGGVYWLLSR